MILCSSLDGLRSWFLNRENLTQFGINLESLPPIKVTTNFTMLNGIWNLFERHGHGDLIDTYRNDVDLIIDLKSFIELPDTDELIAYVRKVGERAKNIQV